MINNTLWYNFYSITNKKIFDFIVNNCKFWIRSSKLFGDDKRRKNKVELTIYTARPGVIIGRGGEDIEKFRKKISKISRTNK